MNEYVAFALTLVGPLQHKGRALTQARVSSSVPFAPPGLVQRGRPRPLPACLPAGRFRNGLRATPPLAGGAGAVVSASLRLCGSAVLR